MTGSLLVANAVIAVFFVCLFLQMRPADERERLGNVCFVKHLFTHEANSLLLL